MKPQRTPRARSRIGLLRAPSRSGAGYRRYGADAARRLERICLYLSAGVPLAEIRRILGPCRRELVVTG